MDWSSFASAGIGALGNLVGGLIGGESSRKANERAEEQAVHNLNAQMEAAQKGITWKARDVMNAYKETGIHPLAMLGISGPTVSPVSSSFQSSPLGDSIGRMGQDVSRAISAGADRELREKALALQTESMAIDNEIKKTELASMRARLMQGSVPARPGAVTQYNVPGQGDVTRAGVIAVKPAEVEAVAPSAPYRQDIGIADYKWARTGPNMWKRVPSKDFKDSTEDMSAMQWDWYFRNSFAPGLINKQEPPFKAPRGKYWVSHLFGTYELRDEKDRAVRPRSRWIGIPSQMP